MNVKGHLAVILLFLTLAMSPLIASADWTEIHQNQSSSQRQRRVNREHKKKNKNRAGFSHRDDERYSVEYNSSDQFEMISKLLMK